MRVGEILKIAKSLDFYLNFKLPCIYKIQTQWKSRFQIWHPKGSISFLHRYTVKHDTCGRNSENRQKFWFLAEFQTATHQQNWNSDKIKVPNTPIWSILTSNNANITTSQSSKFNLWLIMTFEFKHFECVNLWRSQKFEFSCIIAEKEFNRHKAWVAQTAVFYQISFEAFWPLIMPI